MSEKELIEIEAANAKYGDFAPQRKIVAALCAELREAREIISDVTLNDPTNENCPACIFIPASVHTPNCIFQRAEGFLKGEQNE